MLPSYTLLSWKSRYLLSKANTFKSATDGNWNDLFFKDTESEHGYQRRVRAVVQNLNDNFAKRLSVETSKSVRAHPLQNIRRLHSSVYETPDPGEWTEVGQVINQKEKK